MPLFFLFVAAFYVSITLLFASTLGDVSCKIGIVLHEMLYRIYFGLDVYEELRYSARYYYD